MPKEFSAAAKAEELCESFINGNRKWVIEELYKLPKKRAIAVAVYVEHYLSNPDDDYDVNVFRRMLTDRL